MTFPKIGISIGDPGGIGPEITLKTLSESTSLPKAHYIIFASSLVIEEEKKGLGLKMEIPPFIQGTSQDYSGISLQEINSPLKIIKKGFSSEENGLASFLYFKEAFEEAKKGKIQALVTAPISKKSWNLAGLEWRGHTDYLNQFYPQAIMAFWSGRMKVALYSHHLPLKLALEKIKKEPLLKFFSTLYQNIEKIQPGKFEYLIAGLNPHAGEDGLLGKEEEEEIIPAIKIAQSEGMRITGPFPPDIIFRNALDNSDKIVIALYHDQGLIPFKLEAFETGVNVTLGLPFIRTSPDHGTAFSIAGKNVANPQSMIEALKLAYDLSPSSFKLGS